MVSECLEYLAIRPDGIYLDATAGLGGHTGAIAARLTSGLVIANDRDAESLELARSNTVQWADRIRYRQGSFADLRTALEAAGIERVDGLLADLGVSRYQLTDPERGFSLMAEGPLDMRMDRNQAETAEQIVNFSSEKELADLIYRLGEERRSRRISRAIVRARPIHTTQRLSRVIEEAVPRTGKLHPATLTFMALRLAVNDEQGQLDRLLALAPDLVKSGGRIAIVSFMSLEDRKVKHSFQALSQAGRATILTRHVVRPAPEEAKNNPPSRSARLRAVEMR
jgi:16S rRNA (cytosine1402-N4)-methyltransferase